MQKKYLVLGAGGSIGSETVRRLQAAEHLVFACVRRSENDKGDKWSDVLGYEVVFPLFDVSNRFDMRALANGLAEYGELDGVIYAVGHCPPGGYSEAVRYPLSELRHDVYLQETQMHQIGVLNVFQCFLPKLKAGGCMLFMSSAITRFKGKTFPADVHPHYHASVIAAEDWLIEGMRHDPLVKNRGITIHRIAPAGINTPFHQGSSIKTTLVSIGTVVDRVIAALSSSVNIDLEILANEQLAASR